MMDVTTNEEEPGARLRIFFSGYLSPSLRGIFDFTFMFSVFVKLFGDKFPLKTDQQLRALKVSGKV